MFFQGKNHYELEHANQLYINLGLMLSLMPSMKTSARYLGSQILRYLKICYHYFLFFKVSLFKNILKYYFLFLKNYF